MRSRYGPTSELGTKDFSPFLECMAQRIVTARTSGYYDVAGVVASVLYLSPAVASSVALPLLKRLEWHRAAVKPTLTVRRKGPVRAQFTHGADTKTHTGAHVRSPAISDAPKNGSGPVRPRAVNRKSLPHNDIRVRAFLNSARTVRALCCPTVQDITGQ